MIGSNLITQCTCGNRDNFTFDNLHEIPVAVCNHCGVTHQLLDNFTANDLKDFYEHQYHISFQKKKGVITYQDRYQHDCSIAAKRLEQYRGFIVPGMIGLDVGSSNSAFVHEANKLGFRCLGLEPGEDIGDSSVTIRGTLDTAYMNPGHFDFVTLHDSVEHMIDPKTALLKVNTLLNDSGRAILDLPDFFDPSGRHHWKLIEHLWFFTEQQFIKLLDDCGFAVEKITRPIPGKLVFYTRKKA